MSTENKFEKPRPKPEIVVEAKTPRQKTEELQDMSEEERRRVVQGNIDALVHGGGKIKLTPEEAKVREKRQRRLEENQERAA